ncbi:tRNA-modifying protein YgfZ [Microbulbifer aggregans]|uniref:tRNA-modifying protein YgfZ n=1 Tax=Microbulbifer aggregans TaxID=1769779 RepID=A0A1C9WBF3_9GAMM|nr:folate-binding protein YgfZ [Microbulbifer aggregans]AOS98476.1 tRNA-modifying protein YgfZ [Microbulbifer aggregans]
MDRKVWQEFLSGEGAKWEGDRAHFPDAQSDLHLVDLSPLGAVSVHGPDSQKFLQGQLTCDLVNLPDGHGTPGAHCNPKGRMISAFNALKKAQNDILLSLPRDLAPIALAALAKYVVFFKTDLKELTDSHHWLGLQGTDVAARAADLLALPELSHLEPGAAHPFKFDGQEALIHVLNREQVAILVPMEAAPALWKKLSAGATPAGFWHWQQRLISDGVPQLHTETSGIFIPQMLNLHLLGGVNFKKGCYTGQEVVARLQYLGQAKRRMYRARCDAGNLPAPGLSIVEAGSQKNCGEVVIAERSEHGIDLLAVLANSSVAAGSTLELEDGRPVELLELPYDADADPLTD